MGNCNYPGTENVGNLHYPKGFSMGNLNYPRACFSGELRLPSTLSLKYYSITDASEKLGGIDEIKETFIAFQRYLYANPAA